MPANSLSSPAHFAEMLIQLPDIQMSQQPHPPPRKRLRSELWFNDMNEIGETAVYLERFSNYGISPRELQAGRPVIGIAQTGSDLVPCNRIHMTLVDRVQ